MGRKSLYDANTFPLLAEKYARDGLNDREISKKLGISKATLYVWQNEFPDFLDAIKRGKAPVDIKIENALHKRAEGFYYDEKHTEVKIVNGQPQPAVIRTVRKYVPGDVGAQAFWLKNRNPKQWRDRHDYVKHNPIEDERLPVEFDTLPEDILNQIADHYQSIQSQKDE